MLPKTIFIELYTYAVDIFLWDSPRFPISLKTLKVQLDCQ